MSEQVATAKFPAKLVVERADIRLAEIDAKLATDRAVKIAEMMARPIRRGFLFGRHDHWMAIDEATYQFDHVETASYLGAQGPRMARMAERRKERPLSLRRLARAALQSGTDGVLTLTADDCYSLGIPVVDAISLSEVAA